MTKGTFPRWNIEATETNVELWYTNLQAFSVNDLRRAFTRLRDSGRQDPPSLAEVVSLCKGAEGNRVRYIKASTIGKTLPEDDEFYRGCNIAQLKVVVTAKGVSDDVLRRLDKTRRALVKSYQQLNETGELPENWRAEARETLESML